MDKTILITGGTAGLGRETVRVLAGMGARVIFVARNAEKAARTAAEIERETGAQVAYVLADLAVLAQVRGAAEEVKRRWDRLDVLINNAGAIFWGRRESTDGIEMTLALNHLAYFGLTWELLDGLKASAPARIVNVASSAQYSVKELNLDDLEMRQNYGAFAAYAQSKLANVLFTYELARRLAGTGITANALHPGFVATQIGTNNYGVLGKIARRLFNLRSISVEEGARTMVYLAVSPEVEGVSGQYFERERPKRSAELSYDENLARRLWEISERMTHRTM